MIENVFIGCYWSARKEDRLRCAQRISSCFDALKGIEGASTWYLKTRSKKAALRPIETGVEAVEQRLKTNKRDDDGSTIRELGFNFSAWNGDPDNGISIAVTCGAFSKFIRNSAVLNLPAMESEQVIQNMDTYEKVLRRLVDVWDPENAVVTSSEYISGKGGGMPWEAGGWLSYNQGGAINRSQ